MLKRGWQHKRLPEEEEVISALLKGLTSRI